LTTEINYASQVVDALYASSVRRRIEWCLANGLSVVPIAPGRKQPLLSWKDLEQEPIEPDHLRAIYSNGNNNLAIICNQAFSCLDFETVGDYHEFFPEHDELEKETLVESTPHNGIHVCFANRTTLPRKIRISEEPHAIDLLGTHSYVIISPSTIHHRNCERTKCRLEGFGRYTILGAEQLAVFNFTGSTLLERIEKLGWKASAPISPTQSTPRYLVKKTRSLLQSRKQSIVDAIVPHWQKGVRNQLSISLIAFLLKEGVRQEDATDIVSKICQRTGDEEIASRLKDVDYHYNMGMDMLGRLRGYRGLEKLLSGEDQ
jgi:hypothetical protein